LKVTIKDVAQKAGVSISTVSKVINGSSRISSETKDRIRFLMEEMDYHPNSMARNLVKQQSRNICIVKGLGKDWDAVSNPYVYEIINGMEYRAREADYLISIINVDETRPVWPQLHNYIRTRRIDGFLIFAALADRELIHLMGEESFPFVIIGDPGYETTAGWVDLNNEIAGQQAIEYLYNRGIKNFLYIKSRGDNIICEKRLAGIRKYLKNLKSKEFSLEVKTLEPTIEKGYHFGKEWALSPFKRRGVISSSSFFAAGLLEALKESSIKVPEKIALISFDKYPLSLLTRPQLAVIHMNLKELGDQCCSALLKKLEDPGLILQLTISSSTLIKGGTV
jgi:DNA-binding LacI/PurR family transcriptional regulator